MCWASGPDGVNRRTVPLPAGPGGGEVGSALAGGDGAGSATSFEGATTRTSPPTSGVIRNAPATDVGSIGPSKTIAIGVRMPIPDTPSAGTTDSIPRPAATVVNEALNGAARWLPSVSAAPLPTVIV